MTLKTIDSKKLVALIFLMLKFKIYQEKIQKDYLEKK
jgi:hypothetical protein